MLSDIVYEARCVNNQACTLRSQRDRGKQISRNTRLRSMSTRRKSQLSSRVSESSTWYAKYANMQNVITMQRRLSLKRRKTDTKYRESLCFTSYVSE